MYTAPTSTQHMGPTDLNALECAEIYFDWVDQNIPMAQAKGEELNMVLLVFGRPAIVLERRADAAYHVTGGFAVRPNSGVFEFRICDGELVVSLTGLEPRLPKFAYLCSHFLGHSAVMKAFELWFRAEQSNLGDTT